MVTILCFFAAQRFCEIEGLRVSEVYDTDFAHNLFHMLISWASSSRYGRLTVHFDIVKKSPIDVVPGHKKCVSMPDTTPVQKKVISCPFQRFTKTSLSNVLGMATYEFEHTGAYAKGISNDKGQGIG